MTATSDHEGRAVGTLSRTGSEGSYPLPAPPSRPRMPLLCGAEVHARRPWQADSQEYFPQRQHDLHLVRWQLMVEHRYRPIQVGPTPARSFAAIVKSPPVPSPRVLSPVSPAVLNTTNLPRAISSLAHAKVTVSLPACAVEVKRAPRPRPPGGIWSDGPDLDALDDLDVDPTPERQFQVQARVSMKPGR